MKNEPKDKQEPKAQNFSGVLSAKSRKESFQKFFNVQKKLYF